MVLRLRSQLEKKNSPSLAFSMLLENQNFIVLECFVAAGDDTLAGLQALEDLIVLRILTAYADITAVGFAAAFVEYEDPLSSCGLEEGTARDDDGLLRLS